LASADPGSRNVLAVRFAGEGGEGVVSAGELLARAAARAGREVFAVRNVPTEVQGGFACVTVRSATAPVPSAGDGIDVLIAFSEAAGAPHRADLRAGGFHYYNSDAGPTPAHASPATGVPLDSVARRETGSARDRNLVALGVGAAVLGLEAGPVADLAVERLGGRTAGGGEAVRRAVRAGHDLVRERRPGGGGAAAAPPSAGAGRLVLTGNEAVALGAIAAGCRRFFGYPITPATEILDLLAAELPGRGGVALSVEDEMAALAMCLGSSFAGGKAMTATSGPGFSLMAELLGLAAAEEIPVVVVDVQRAGPSTGLPTKTEQGDLLAAVFGGHGDFPRVVIAPVDVEDAFHQAVNAFNLAETHQVPVILLSDQDLAQRIQTVRRPDVGSVRVAERATVPAGDGPFRRYADAPGGVSPMPVPGTPGLCWRASGQEHDETGLPSADPANHVRMMRRRAARLEAIPGDACGVASCGDPAAETLVLGWGSTYGAVREAVERLCAGGVPVRALYPKRLWPYPASLLDAPVARARRVVVPEANFSGPFARLVGMHHGVPVHRVNRYDGRPFAPGELADRIREIARGGAGAD
jgi:2-oxoglutarate ferredoxin oxidoreductase subunit alpha